MKKKVLKDIELEKISGGNLKKFNRGLEYTTAGISLVAGLVAVGNAIANEIDRIKNPYRNKGSFIDLDGLFTNLFRLAGVVGAVLTIDGTRRIVSQAKDLY